MSAAPPPRPKPKPLDGSPDHEQERLLRQAANALLAAPIYVAATFGALLRRSSRARVGVVFSLAVLLGYGALSAGRPEPIAATAGVPILPLTEASFETVFATDTGLSEPVTLHFSAPLPSPPRKPPSFHSPH